MFGQTYRLHHRRVHGSPPHGGKLAVNPKRYPSVHGWGELDLRAADLELKRVDELGGSNQDYGHLDMIMGRPDQAMAKIHKALDLDPFNPLAQSFYAIILHCERRYDDAIAQARKTLAMQPGAPVAQAA